MGKYMPFSIRVKKMKNIDQSVDTTDVTKLNYIWWFKILIFGFDL